jgi:hypothetical protein
MTIFLAQQDYKLHKAYFLKAFNTNLKACRKNVMTSGRQDWVKHSFVIMLSKLKNEITVLNRITNNMIFILRNLSYTEYVKWHHLISSNILFTLLNKKAQELFWYQEKKPWKKCRRVVLISFPPKRVRALISQSQNVIFYWTI